jgi:DNA-binding MarR family transcriptional regulator
MNNKDIILEQLRTLGLTNEEAKLYLELLKEPSTHLKLAHSTGINRTKIYRLAEDLEKRSLITKRTDDRGTFLVASDPASLEVTLVSQEEKLAKQRSAFTHLMPALSELRKPDAYSFIVLTYEGVEGFKQMLWHELKTKGDELIFGSGTIEDLVPEHEWAEKHRALTVEAGYTIRELLNPGEKEQPFTLNSTYMHRYVHRDIPRELLTLQDQLCIYNDTVATYHWRNNEKVGVEIISKSYATTMRQLFEHYWQLAGH